MTTNSEHDDGLKEYRSRRDAETTPEPFGHRVTADRTGGPGVFVVQLHAARQRHYDFRLEMNGVLESWVVPRGPSLDPAEKRAAIRVESHPVEYATFEGVIPEGNYGAGAVIVWDSGVWIPIEDPKHGIDQGKLLFDLRGYKLRGRFTLVQTRRRGQPPGKEWLLIKKPDGFAVTTTTSSDPERRPEGTDTGDAPDAPGSGPGDESIFSGLTVDEVKNAGDREHALIERIAELDAPARDLDIKKIDPMLCQRAREPFSDAGWIFEIKYDGYRLMAAKIGKKIGPDGKLGGPQHRGDPYLRYRSGLPATHLFPDLARAVAALPFHSFIIDGEVVVLGDDGKPVFSRLQGRTQLQRPADIRRAAMLEPVTMVVFDLLAFAGHDLRGLPVLERKALLRQILPRVGPLRYGDHIPERGEDFYRAVVAQGLEGVVAKRADSPYQGQRSDAWLKVRGDREGDFAIVGFTSPQGNRVGFGSLHLAVWDGRKWLYAGRVGSGFGARELEVLSQTLRAMQPWEPTFAPPSSPQREDHWVAPRLVCTVKYQDWPAGSHLRFPSFLHLRGDKRPRDCEVPAHVRDREDPAAPGDAPADEVASAELDAPRPDDPRPDPATPTPVHPAGSRVASPAASPAASTTDDAPRVRTTNLDKIFWPATDDHPAYSKGDLITYYREIAPWILPYLRDRPVVLTRYPDGIDGKSFFQKDAPSWVPGWIRTETLWSKHAQREVHYFICDDEDTLVFLANMGTIPLHIWSSRIETLSQPDWALLDLDPKGAPFEHVVRVARAIHALCRDLELRSFVKTSGQDGLHVMIPLAGACTYDQSRALAHLLAKVIESEHPDIATTHRSIDRRGGKVYLDYVQNAHGRLVAAPYSVRPRPGAPVSMPLRWSQVTRKLDTTRYTMKTALRRLRRLTTDPLLDVLEVGSDLALALERLGQRVAE